MWTGQYPHYFDCWNNHEGLRPGTPILLDALRATGYQIQAIGPLDYAWGMHSIRDRVGSWTRAAEVLRPICRTPLPVISESEDLFARDWQWAEQAVEWLQRQRSDDRPFFLYLTTGLVHPAFKALRRHMELIDPSRIETPPGLCHADDEPHPVDRYTRVTKHCEQPFSAELVREIRHVYAAMVAALDEIVGHVARALDELGLSDRTYLAFSSDHGEMAGEHNQILKRTMYEPSIHVPLIFAGPEAKHGARVDTPVSLVDLYPTFLEMAGTSYRDIGCVPGRAESLVGESLLPQILGAGQRQRDWVFAEYHGDRCSTGTFMLRRDRWKLIRHEGYASRLFDVESDPWEQVDLCAAEPAAREELSEILDRSFDCRVIDARAKEYDRASFLRWREEALGNGTYRETMAKVYSGFDHLCIEDIVPWRDEDEERIERWLRST
jgi:arylsulfatase A-like enzyme